MAIMATAGDSKAYTPAPAGVHQAVCVDVIDKGLQPNQFKPGTTQRKIDLAWQLDEKREDGKKFIVYKRYTLSLNEKATLRKDLESWRGRSFTRDEEMGFDVEQVLGANCLVNIQHATKDNRTYSNVVAVMPLARGMVKLAAVDYVREKDRKETAEEPEGNGAPLTEDDIPF